MNDIHGDFSASNGPRDYCRARVPIPSLATKTLAKRSTFSLRTPCKPLKVPSKSSFLLYVFVQYPLQAVTAVLYSIHFKSGDLRSVVASHCSLLRILASQRRFKSRSLTTETNLCQRTPTRRTGSRGSDVQPIPRMQPGTTKRPPHKNNPHKHLSLLAAHSPCRRSRTSIRRG